MFPGGMGNMQAMMRKVQKMQADIAKMQEDMKKRTFETSVGGGAITVVVSGKKEAARPDGRAVLLAEKEGFEPSRPF